MNEPLREGDVVGRFRAGILVDTAPVLEVMPAAGGAQAEKVRWERGTEPQTGDDVRRILM